MTYALRAAIAAEKLEGWQPTADEIEVLESFAHSRLTMTDYLAWTRRQYVDESEVVSPVFARRRPYYQRGSDVLANSLGLTTHAALQSAEYAMTAGRFVQAFHPTARPELTVVEAHRQLFADIYPWAGDYRLTTIRKGGTRFARVDEIAGQMERVNSDLTEAFACATGYNTEALGYRMARIYAEYNVIHPFREGNGRTGSLLLAMIARRGGYELDFLDVTRREWNDAARSAATQPCDIGPLRALFERSLVRLGNDVG